MDPTRNNPRSGLIVLLLAVCLSGCFTGTAHVFGTTPQPTPAPAPDPGQRMAWYIRLTPQPPNGPFFYVGPWRDLAVCRDILGSMYYRVGWGCHLGDTTACQPPLGNGNAYPRNWAWVSKGHDRVPLEHQIPANPTNDCEKLPLATSPHLSGWVGLYYGNDGQGVAFPAAQRPIWRAKVRAGLGQFVLGGDPACPGWPNILVGSTLGQQDYAC